MCPASPVQADSARVLWVIRAAYDVCAVRDMRCCESRNVRDFPIYQYVYVGGTGIYQGIGGYKKLPEILMILTTGMCYRIVTGYPSVTAIRGILWLVWVFVCRQVGCP